MVCLGSVGNVKYALFWGTQEWVCVCVLGWPLCNLNRNLMHNLSLYRQEEVYFLQVEAYLCPYTQNVPTNIYFSILPLPSRTKSPRYELLKSSRLHVTRHGITRSTTELTTHSIATWEIGTTPVWLIFVENLLEM